MFRFSFVNLSFFPYQVNISILGQLIDKIREDIPSLESNEESEQINKHFQNTLSHIQVKKEGTDDSEPLYEGLNF